MSDSTPGSLAGRSLSARERWLLAIAPAAVLFALWAVVIRDPGAISEAREAAAAAQRRAPDPRQLAELAERTATTRDEADRLRAERESVRDRIVELEATASRAAAGRVGSLDELGQLLAAHELMLIETRPDGRRAGEGMRQRLVFAGAWSDVTQLLAELEQRRLGATPLSLAMEPWENGGELRRWTLTVRSPGRAGPEDDR